MMPADGAPYMASRLRPAQAWPAIREAVRTCTIKAYGGPPQQFGTAPTHEHNSATYLRVNVATRVAS
jgi:hypothetical protein